MKNILVKDTVKQISKTRKRFISILLMAFLGVGFFAGVRSASPDMKLTIDKYFDDNQVHDLSVVSTLGLTDEDVEAISKVEGVDSAYGIYSEDVFMNLKDEDIVVKVYELKDNINRPELIEGRFPEKDDECVIDSNMTELRDVQIGQEIEIEENLDTTDEKKSFKNSKLKVVGLVRSPLYASRDRGTTKLGTGKIAHFMYVKGTNIDSDYYTEIGVKVKGAKELKTLSPEYKDLVASIQNNIEDIKEDREKVRSENLKKEANDKLNDAQKEFDDKKAEGEQKISDAEKDINKAKKDIKDAEVKISDGEKELADKRKEADQKFAEADQTIKDNDWKLAQASQAITDNVIFLEGKKKEAQANMPKIDAGIQQVDKTINQLNQNKAEIEKGLNTIKELKSGIAENNKNMEILKNMLSTTTDPDTITEINKEMVLLTQLTAFYEQGIQTAEAKGATQDNLNRVTEGLKMAADKKQELINTKNNITKQLNDADAKIVMGQNEITNGRNKLNEARNELARQRADADKKFKDAENDIAKGKKELADGKVDLADGEKKLADAKKEFDEKIRDAEEKLIDAREKVNDIDTAKWYVFDRNDNAGYNEYEQDSGNIQRLGVAFPIVFFIIATLTSLTTMSRMVEEERVEIGTLKALGYSKLQIMSKYILYAFLASFVGGIVGALFGSQFFPRVIIYMYQLMYNIENLVIEFNWYYSVTGIIIMILCIVGSTVYTASKELIATPAQMMRPKAPKAGKRVLIEKIPFLWNRFNFTQKVTLRNMFRYKKRFLMTVVGICGCTALILAGFGLKDSVSRIMDYQYVDIYNYDMMVALKDTLTAEETQNVISTLEGKEEINKVIPVNLVSEDAKVDDKKFETQVLVAENSDVLEQVIRLKNKKTGERLYLNDEEVIITDKLAQLLEVKKGDEIIIHDSEEGDKTLKVGEITEHYIGHYIYMTENLYNSLFEEKAKTNVLLTNYQNDLNQDQEYDLSKDILVDPKVGSIMLSSNIRETMNDTLSAMNLVVYVLIASAGILAFVVLYNLANINISERIRELATIKVLGFYDKEVYDYVTREIILLTIIGILFGLVFGYLLNSFILGTCEIEMLRFKRIILPQSYLYSIAITVVFTCIVNCATYFRLKKINMIESLKSVE